jgi:hypothetical protein
MVIAARLQAGILTEADLAEPEPEAEEDSSEEEQAAI